MCTAKWAQGPISLRTIKVGMRSSVQECTLGSAVPRVDLDCFPCQSDLDCPGEREMIPQSQIGLRTAKFDGQ